MSDAELDQALKDFEDYKEAQFTERRRSAFSKLIGNSQEAIDEAMAQYYGRRKGDKQQ